MGHIGDFLEFIVKLVFWLYMLLVMLRFLLQLVRANFHTPVAQFVITATNPVLRPLRRVIPGLGGIDLAALILLFVLQLGEIVLIGLLPGPQHHIPSSPGLFLLTIGLLIDQFVFFYIVSITVQTILSWVNPIAFHHPIGSLILQLNEPLLRPIRSKFKPINGFDISPLIFIVMLMAVHYLIAAPLIDAAALTRLR